jgi:transcriptional regulator with XRE-family HTH domain
MKTSLDSWLKFGWLKKHSPSQREIADLLGVADRDLAASKTPGLISDWRLNIAYNAALQLATAALAAAGYEAERSQHHYRVIQSLELTIGADSTTVANFDTFRKKRNVTDYEKANMISEAEADDMLAFAETLRRDVEAWIRKKHPKLIP